MNPKTLNVYLGWDSREDVAFQVARASIVDRTKEPIKVIPLRLEHLGMLTRPIEKRGNQLWCPISQAPMSTEFAISRFCVPHLQDEGWALGADCDILCLEDIKNLFDLADDRYAVMVVKHEILADKGGQALPEIKMDGQLQTYYGRKNWSSVVLWNCSHPAHRKFIENDLLNVLPGRDLHGFCWLGPNDIGELPQKWNWLINVTPGKPKEEGIWHYTLGGPWLKGWKANKYDEVWINENKYVP